MSSQIALPYKLEDALPLCQCGEACTSSLWWDKWKDQTFQSHCII